MKTALSCILIVFVGALQLQAYEPPKGITWNMTKPDIDSVFGITFKPQFHGYEFFVAYEATDSPYLIEGEKIVKGLLKMDIYNTQLYNLNFLISKESKKLVRFEIQFSSDSDIPNIWDAMTNRYGRPDKGDGNTNIWLADDSSEVVFELVPDKEIQGYYHFIGIVYNSPEYHKLVLAENRLKSKKREEERLKKQEARNKAIEDSEF